MIQTSDWLKLQPHVSEDCKELCNLCYEFEKKINNLRLVSPSLTGMDIQDVQILAHRILAEYLKIIQEKVDEDTFSKVQKDIWKTLSVFFTEKGDLKDITGEVTGHKERGTLDMFFQVYISPLLAFNHSRIHDSLKEALKKIQPTFTIEFINSSSKKAGIMPEVRAPEKALKDLEEATKPTKKKD